MKHTPALSHVMAIVSLKATCDKVGDLIRSANQVARSTLI